MKDVVHLLETHFLKLTNNFIEIIDVLVNHNISGRHLVSHGSELLT